MHEIDVGCNKLMVVAGWLPLPRRLCYNGVLLYVLNGRNARQILKQFLWSKKTAKPRPTRAVRPSRDVVPSVRKCLQLACFEVHSRILFKSLLEVSSLRIQNIDTINSNV